VRRAGRAVEAISELLGRKTAGLALRAALPALLPALGGARQPQNRANKPPEDI